MTQKKAQLSYHNGSIMNDKKTARQWQENNHINRQNSTKLPKKGDSTKRQQPRASSVKPVRREEKAQRPSKGIEGPDFSLADLVPCAD